MKCPVQHCPTCKDRMIHQTKRQSDESSSAIGQFVHDRLSKKLYWADIDGALLKRANRVLRAVEHKFRGQDLRPSQRAVLPILAEAIDVLIERGRVHPDSGVFVLTADPPFDDGYLRQIGGQKVKGRIRGKDVKNFLEGGPGGRKRAT